MDEDLRSLERYWRASRAWADWLRWARACARSGDPAPLVFVRSCERTRVGAKRVVRLSELVRWEHRDRRKWIEELREQAEHVTSQSRRRARRALLELMRRGVSPLEHGAYSYDDMSHYAVGNVPEDVKRMQDVLGDPGKVRAISRQSRLQTDVARRLERSTPPLSTLVRCREAGCPVLTPETYCTHHERRRADAAALTAGLYEAVGAHVRPRVPGDHESYDDAFAEGIREAQEGAEARERDRGAPLETSGNDCVVCHHFAHGTGPCTAHVLRTHRQCRCPLVRRASDGPRT